MSARHYLKRNDTGIMASDQLMLDGAAINLSGASVALLIESMDTAVVLRRTATITDAANGKVQYQFIAADTATAGDYQLEWEVTLSNGKIITVPSGGYINLTIKADLA
jgi:hypothetical protein